MKSESRCRVAMAGRSVMGNWFKYWNYPGILSRHANYLPWPIPYKTYAMGDYRFEYIRIIPPDPRGDDAGYGRKTLTSLFRQVGGEKYQALFFKFCYIDFGDKWLNGERAQKELLGRMKSLIGDVHAFAAGRKVKLLVGTALPVLKEGAYAQSLRLEYNAWLKGYAETNREVAVFDLFGLLTDGNGRLRHDLARSPSDPHLNNEAYRILERELFVKLTDLR